MTTCPLWITGESGRHRRVTTTGFVLDLVGFSPASDAELTAAGHVFARNGDLIELDAILTGSGVLVIRQPQQVTVVTDLAGVWPVFYAMVAGSLIYSSSAAAVAAHVGTEVDTPWLTARLLTGSVPETWSEGSDLSLVARTVSQRYGVPFHQVLTDTRLLAGTLTDAGLLERTP